MEDAVDDSDKQEKGKDAVGSSVFFARQNAPLLVYHRALSLAFCCSMFI